jgi:hypothetical protein
MSALDIEKERLRVVQTGAAEHGNVAQVIETESGTMLVYGVNGPDSAGTARRMVKCWNAFIGVPTADIAKRATQPAPIPVQAGEAQGQQEHVMPPFAARAWQHDADLVALANDVLMMVPAHGRGSFGKQSDFDHYVEGHEHARIAAKDRILEFGSRCRVQGGNTQPESGCAAIKAGGQVGEDGEITDVMADAGAQVLYCHSRAEATEWAKEDKFDSCADQAREVYKAIRAAITAKETK